jgi:hypothetical protein
MIAILYWVEATFGADSQFSLDEPKSKSAAILRRASNAEHAQRRA